MRWRPGTAPTRAGFGSWWSPRPRAGRGRPAVRRRPGDRPARPGSPAAADRAPCAGLLLRAPGAGLMIETAVATATNRARPPRLYRGLVPRLDTPRPMGPEL